MSKFANLLEITDGLYINDIGEIYSKAVLEAIELDYIATTVLHNTMDYSKSLSPLYVYNSTYYHLIRRGSDGMVRLLKGDSEIDVTVSGIVRKAVLTDRYIAIATDNSIHLTDYSIGQHTQTHQIGVITDFDIIDGLLVLKVGGTYYVITDNQKYRFEHNIDRFYNDSMSDGVYYYATKFDIHSDGGIEEVGEIMHIRPL